MPYHPDSYHPGSTASSQPQTFQHPMHHLNAYAPYPGSYPQHAWHWPQHPYARGRPESPPATGARASAGSLPSDQTPSAPTTIPEAPASPNARSDASSTPASAGPHDTPTSPNASPLPTQHPASAEPTPPLNTARKPRKSAKPKPVKPSALSPDMVPVRRLSTLPSQLKLDAPVRIAILTMLAERGRASAAHFAGVAADKGDSPASAPPPSPTLIAAPTSPPLPPPPPSDPLLPIALLAPTSSSASPALPGVGYFDHLDFQLHPPATRDAWLADNGFAAGNGWSRWRTVDRHAGRRTQLVVYQCKCGVPDRADGGRRKRKRVGADEAPADSEEEPVEDREDAGKTETKEREGASKRSIPYVGCRAFVHMTCDRDGVPLVVRGIFTHSPACKSAKPLARVRGPLHAEAERRALALLERNVPLGAVLADNRAWATGNETEQGRVALTREDVRNLRRALLKRRPELKVVRDARPATEGSPDTEKRKVEGDEDAEPSTKRAKSGTAERSTRSPTPDSAGVMAPLPSSAAAPTTPCDDDDNLAVEPSAAPPTIHAVAAPTPVLTVTTPPWSTASSSSSCAASLSPSAATSPIASVCGPPRPTPRAAPSKPGAAWEDTRPAFAELPRAAAPWQGLGPATDQPFPMPFFRGAAPAHHAWGLPPWAPPAAAPPGPPHGPSWGPLGYACPPAYPGPVGPGRAGGWPFPSLALDGRMGRGYPSQAPAYPSSGPAAGRWGGAEGGFQRVVKRED
ncbi:hypothetical protein HDU96_003723 [Phlyctochytrium bullatum]|nr:hypothetical protein HDU96_003723 [Phlyctochytrium bullatum]